MSQNPADLVPHSADLFKNGDGTILLLIIGAVCLGFVAYLVFDHFQVRRRARKFEARRAKMGSSPVRK